MSVNKDTIIELVLMYFGSVVALAAVQALSLIDLAPAEFVFCSTAGFSIGMLARVLIMRRVDRRKKT